jgi:CRP/FNR family cyclic AMP-dependent transcriptional regulator
MRTPAAIEDGRRWRVTAAIAAEARQEALACLPVADREAIARVARVRRWPSGAGIHRRGEESGQLVLITRGRVRLSVLAPGGNALSLSHAGPGSMIGEIGVLGGGPHPDDAAAITDVEALAIARADVHRLRAERPAIAGALIAALCDRVRSTADQLESIALYSVEARLARLLLARVRGSGPFVVTDLGMTQTEVAELIGASRPRVNQAFARLEAAGAVRRTARGLRCDIDRLSERAQRG